MPPPALLLAPPRVSGQTKTGSSVRCICFVMPLSQIPTCANRLVLEGRVATRLLSSRACATPTALTSDEQCRFPFSSGGQVLSARRSRAQACSNVRGRYGEGGKEEEEEEGEEGGPEEEDGGYGTAETRRRAPLRPCKG